MPGPPWLVLPTYNEAENLETVVTAARAVLAAAAPDGFRILVVDDSSPDGTGAIADRLAADYPGEVEVLHRTERTGLGPAYLAGFGRALDGGAGFVLEMDADLSHDPADIARLLDAVRARRRPRARLALRPGRRDRRLGARAPRRSAAAGRGTRAASSGSACATSPAASSASARRRSRRSTSRRSARTATPSRSS